MMKTPSSSMSRELLAGSVAALMAATPMSAKAEQAEQPQPLTPSADALAFCEELGRVPDFADTETVNYVYADFEIDATIEVIRAILFTDRDGKETMAACEFQREVTHDKEKGLTVAELQSAMANPQGQKNVAIHARQSHLGNGILHRRDEAHPCFELNDFYTGRPQTSDNDKEPTPCKPDGVVDSGGRSSGNSDNQEYQKAFDSVFKDARQALAEGKFVKVNPLRYTLRGKQDQMPR